MAFSDPFAIDNQYASVPLAFVLIVALAALTEEEAMRQVMSVFGAAFGAVALRAVLPSSVYDYCALGGLLSPLLFGVGLTYHGLGLPPLADMFHYLLYISIAVTVACILICSTKMHFTDCQSMDVHLMCIPLVFGFIICAAAIAEPEQDLQSILTVVAVVIAVVTAAVVCPRWCYDYLALGGLLGCLLGPTIFVVVTAWGAFELPSINPWLIGAWPGLVVLSYYIAPVQKW